MNKKIYKRINLVRKRKRKLFSVLVDPEKFDVKVIMEANRAGVDFIFIGGSRLKNGSFHRCINSVRRHTKIPLVIFPGGREQISEKADAILLLSLISGRNPDYLIGEHIRVSRQLKKSRLEIIPTGYILIGGGKRIAAQQVTRTTPIKSADINLAVSTSIAGELLGMKMIYLEAGSGAKNSLSASLVRTIRRNISVPLIAGGASTRPKKQKPYAGQGRILL